MADFLHPRIRSWSFSFNLKFSDAGDPSHILLNDGRFRKVCSSVFNSKPDVLGASWSLSDVDLLFSVGRCHQTQTAFVASKTGVFRGNAIGGPVRPCPMLRAICRILRSQSVDCRSACSVRRRGRSHPLKFILVHVWVKVRVKHGHQPRCTRDRVFPYFSSMMPLCLFHHP